MSRYRVITLLTIGVHTEVEAGSEEEAISEALSRPPTALCHNAETETAETAWVTSGELDGMPCEDSIRAERLGS